MRVSDARLSFSAAIARVLASRGLSTSPLHNVLSMAISPRFASRGNTAST